MRTIVVLVLVVVASGALLEGLVRMSGIAAHLYTDPAFQPSRDGTSWRYRPEFEGVVLGPTAVRINALGARRAAGPPDAGAATGPTIAVFGDSITFGQGVASDATFPAALQRRLTDRWPHVRVLNFGVQGHSLDMMDGHLADRLAEVDPDVVVLVFGSDDLNPERAQSYVDRYGYLTKKTFGPPSPFMDRVRALLRRSHVALAAKNAYLQWRLGRRPAPPGDGAEDAETASRTEAFGAAIRRFDALTAGRDRLVMCIDYRDTALTRSMRATMQRDFPHLTYVDATPRLAGEPLEGLRVPRDGHPNARAHALYADLLEEPVRSALEHARPARTSATVRR